MLTTSPTSERRQLWRVMAKGSFHMGEELIKLLKQRHINITSLATQMKVAAATFYSYKKSETLEDQTLRKITESIGWDLYSEMKRRQAKALGAAYPEAGKSKATVSEPGETFTHVDVDGRKAWVIHINLDDFDDADQLRIVRYIQRLPRRGRKAKK